MEDEKDTVATRQRIFDIASQLTRERLALQLRVIDLEARIKALEADLAEERTRADDNWEAVEDVACGTKLMCPKCGAYHPCRCDK